MIHWRQIMHESPLHKVLLLCFFLVLAYLIGEAIVNVKDINDTWILEGLVPPFVVLTLLYIMIVSFSADLKQISIFSSIFMSTLNLIPQLKYVFIYGYFDPLPHYQFIHELTRSGFIPNSGYYANQYGTTAGSHIFVSELSIITGLDTVAAYKFFLAASPFMIPLTVYLILRKISAPTGLSKIIIITTAITSPILYRFTGTVAIYSLYVLFIYLLILLACERFTTRSTFVIAALVGIRIVVSHTVTSFFLITCLLSILILRFGKKAGEPSQVSSSTFIFSSMTFIVMILAYMSFVSNNNFSTILYLVRDSINSLLVGTPPGSVGYYTSFYELAPLEKVCVLAVRIGKDAVSFFLSILAPLAMFRLKPKENRLRTFYYTLAFPASIAVSTFLLTQLIRPRIMSRGIIYFTAFSPFLMGITLFWFVHSGRHRRFKNAILPTALFCLASISLIQVYPCQPLVPMVSTGYGNYYVMDLRAVNSIYQRSMIQFINMYDLRLNIATDSITSFQIYALAQPSVQTLLTQRTSESEGYIELQLILISSNESARTIPSGKDAILYMQSVQSTIMKNGVIYTNGKSHVVLKFETP